MRNLTKFFRVSEKLVANQSEWMEVSVYAENERVEKERERERAEYERERKRERERQGESAQKERERSGLFKGD